MRAHTLRRVPQVRQQLKQKQLEEDAIARLESDSTVKALEASRKSTVKALYALK